jgi:prepilin-type N-terminal cleavage/methylation domain-containing protein
MLRKSLINGFTLIELLIVVAIISILSSIAVPNFLEAQTRAKVSRVKADMASMSTAIEIYAIDHNNYPYRRNPNWQPTDPRFQYSYYAPLLATKMNDLKVLTTPISYMVKVPSDIFESTVPVPLNTIDYFDPEQTNILANRLNPDRDHPVDVKLWLLLSVGPDGCIGVSETGNPGGYPPQPPFFINSINTEYDPTRGTISLGNVYKMQGSEDFARRVAGINK